MKTVLLRLEGPLQSWGTRSRFGHRDTELEPSKSGVLGLVGAALGMTRDDSALLSRLSSAKLGVRVDQEGRALTDYHSVGGGTFRGRAHAVHGTNQTVLTHRDYLMDASFLAALSFGDDTLADEVHVALASPVWPLFLGRKACPPSLPVHIPGGLVDSEMETALRTAPFVARAPAGKTASHARNASDDASRPLRLVLECEASDEGATARQDLPLSFELSRRAFARRYVRTAWLERSQLTLPPESSECISLVVT